MPKSKGNAAMAKSKGNDKRRTKSNYKDSDKRSEK